MKNKISFAKKFWITLAAVLCVVLTVAVGGNVARLIAEQSGIEYVTVYCEGASVSMSSNLMTVDPNNYSFTVRTDEEIAIVRTMHDVAIQEAAKENLLKGLECSTNYRVRFEYHYNSGYVRTTRKLKAHGLGISPYILQLNEISHFLDKEPDTTEPQTEQPVATEPAKRP